MESSPSFRIYFRRKRQWIDVYLHDVHPNTFANRKGGRWGYFVATWTDCRNGVLGEIHLVESRVRIDSVVHELDHARTEWMLAGGTTITRSTEERMATLLDELARKFYQEYEKYKEKK